MTKDEYWEAHVKKNPRLKDEQSTVTLKVETLKNLMMEAHGKGFDQAQQLFKQYNNLFQKFKDISGK